jgi:excinuclease ABC subunit B
VVPTLFPAAPKCSARRQHRVCHGLPGDNWRLTPLRKRIADILDQLVREDADTAKLIGGGGRQQSRGKTPVPGLSSRARAASGAAGGSEARVDLIALIQELTEQMHTAAAELQFEVAARIRDEIKDLKHELRCMQAAGV